MALEPVNAPDHGQKLQLTECPLCGCPFRPREHRYKHFLNDHRPEDAGLSPLGTIPPNHDQPLTWSSPEHGTPEPPARREELVVP